MITEIGKHEITRHIEYLGIYIKFLLYGSAAIAGWAFAFHNTPITILAFVLAVLALFMDNSLFYISWFWKQELFAKKLPKE